MLLEESGLFFFFLLETAEIHHCAALLTLGKCVPTMLHLVSNQPSITSPRGREKKRERERERKKEREGESE